MLLTDAVILWVAWSWFLLAALFAGRGGSPRHAVLEFFWAGGDGVQVWALAFVVVIAWGWMRLAKADQFRRLSRLSQSLVAAPAFGLSLVFTAIVTLSGVGIAIGWAHAGTDMGDRDTLALVPLVVVGVGVVLATLSHMQAPSLLHSVPRGAWWIVLSQRMVTGSLVCLILTGLIVSVSTVASEFRGVVLSVGVTLMLTMFAWHRKRSESLDQRTRGLMNGINDVLRNYDAANVPQLACSLRALQAEWEPGHFGARSMFAPPSSVSKEVLEVLYMLLWSCGVGELPSAVTKRAEGLNGPEGAVFRDPRLSDLAAVRRAGCGFLAEAFARLSSKTARCSCSTPG